MPADQPLPEHHAYSTDARGQVLPTARGVACVFPEQPLALGFSRSSQAVLRHGTLKEGWKQKLQRTVGSQ